VDFRSAGGQQHDDDDQRAASAEFRIRPHGGGGGGSRAVCTKTQNLCNRLRGSSAFYTPARVFVADHRPWEKPSGRITLSRRSLSCRRETDDNDNKRTSRISASPFLPVGSNAVADGGDPSRAPAAVTVEIGRRVFLVVTGRVLLERALAVVKREAWETRTILF